MVPVFDIEARNWSLPIAVGFFDGETYREYLKVSEDCDVIWDFLEAIGRSHKGIRLYAHNAANYDNRFILDSLTKHGQTVRFVSGLGKIVWVETNISFEDSYLLIGLNLKSCCDAFNVPRKLDWDHSTTTNIWEMGRKIDAFRAYLKRDCLALSQAIDAFSNSLLDNFGITPSATLSLTAVKAFDKGFFPVKEIVTNEDFEVYIRKATYGGRNEVYKRYGENIFFYDVKRMFVSCYDVPIPIGKMHWVRPNIDKGVLVEAKVKVPNTMVGPLPYRLGSALIFPTGEFQGWWDLRELRNAIQNYKVDATLIRQLDCEEEVILKDFGELTTNLGDSSNVSMGKIWKIFGLRLSGKFGQHRMRTEIKHIKDIEDQTGYYPIDKSEIYHETTVFMKGHRSPYIKPAVNMRIRAEARIRHLRYMAQARDLYYCDTDSVYTTTSMHVGTKPGDLRLVDFAQKAWFIGCKFYGYVTVDDILKQRTAGFRDFKLAEFDFENLLQGKEIAHIFSSLGDWRDTLKGNGVRLVDRRFTFREAKSRNRIVSGIETLPIQLPLEGPKLIL